jgi:hypothetical protein
MAASTQLSDGDDILEKRIVRQRSFGIQQMPAMWAGEQPQNHAWFYIAPGTGQLCHG